MRQLLIISTAVMLLLFILHCQKREDIKGLLPAKALLSTLFVLAALVQPHFITFYYHFVLAGLLFCLIGDVCLALPGDKMFLWGLISFLVGHVFFLFGFLSVARTGPWAYGGTLIICAVSGMIYLRLKPYLGSMNLPVVCYCIVITFMLSGAWSVLNSTALSLAGRTTAFCGALLFYISDVFVARNRFVKKDFFNRLVGLPLYYVGQFMLAFSVGLLK